MDNIVRRMIRDEKGAAMALTVILLLVAGLVVASLLSFMGTGLFTGRVYEGRVAELYGADAGVEDAVWKIQNSVVGDDVYQLYCGKGNHTLTYPKDDDPPIIVNGRSVEVTIAYVDDFTYRVVSTATSEDGGTTQVEAYVAGVSVSDDYSGILDQVLTSQGQFYCPENKVCSCDKLAGLVDPPCYVENGPEWDYDGAWPDTSQELQKFADFYWQQVRSGTHYASPIDLGGNNMTLSAGYVDDTVATITNSEQGEESTPVLKLEGPLYFEGRSQINPTQEMILDLNRQTLFVESPSIRSGDGYALWIGAGGGGVNTKLKIKGPGIIIAVGDIYFAPGEQMGGDDCPIFIFSVSGTAELQPGGAFYGAVAASVQVELKSNNNVYYPEGGFDAYGLNFPGFGGVQLSYSIASWQVTPLAPSEQ